jgi:hypothetical protein
VRGLAPMTVAMTMAARSTPLLLPLPARHAPLLHQQRQQQPAPPLRVGQDLESAVIVILTVQVVCVTGDTGCVPLSAAGVMTVLWSHSRKCHGVRRTPVVMGYVERALGVGELAAMAPLSAAVGGV